VFSNEPRLMDVIRTPEIRANGISITTNTIIYSVVMRVLDMRQRWSICVIVSLLSDES
jgi:hypothetical protein